MQHFDGHEYVDVDEAVQLLGVKKATLYAYVSRGVLRSFKQGVGRRRLYRRADVEALRALRPSSAASASGAEDPAPQPGNATLASDDRVLRDVELPNAETWAGDH